MKRKIACMFMALMLVISLLPAGAIHTRAASYLLPSENVVGLIKQYEGFSASAYPDGNQWTIGYGTTGTAGQVISEYEADLALRSSLNAVSEKVNQFATSNGLNLTQYQHDALISFSFNCGTDWMTQGGRFYQAVVRHAGVNEFLFAISLWANVGSTPNTALISRRLSEANLYLNGVYSKFAPAAYTYTVFDPNGGVAGSGGEDKMQAYLSGSNVNIMVGNPSKSGLSFGGWFTAPSGGSAVKYLSAATAGTTVYAQYGVPVSVTGSYAYLRNGAGTAYTQTGTVSAGTQLIIVETAQVGGAMWGRCADGWIGLEYTNYVNGTQIGNQTGTQTGTQVGIQQTATNGTVVCSTGVHIRSGAGTNYASVGAAYNGQRVTVYEIVSVGGVNWGRIGQNQWICLTYVRLDNTVSVPGTGTGIGTGIGSGVIWDNGNSNTQSGAGTITGTAYTLGTVTTNGLRVRVAAGVGNAVVTTLNRGTQVKVYSQIIKDNAPWGRIDQGWVCMNYVQLTGGTGTGNTTTNGTVIATGVVSANTGLNVRSGAGLTAPRVSTLSPGASVNIYEKTTVNGMDWGRIGQNQWICLAYVRLTSGTTIPSTPSTPSTGTTGTGTVISSTNLNIRSGPGNYPRVGSLTPGSVVTIYEVALSGNQQWGRIGTNQWVCMTYVRMNSTGTGSTTIPSTGYTGRVTSRTNLHVRAAAGTNNAIVGNLAPGSIITIYQLTNVNGVSWGRTGTGWVCMNYVQLTGGTGTGTGTGTGSGVIWQ